MELREFIKNSIKEYLNETKEVSGNEDINNTVHELYHYTSEINFDKIMDSNKINTSKRYGNRLSVTSDDNYHRKNNGLDYENLKVRITLDNDKLINDGIIFTPFDHNTKQNKLGKEFEYIISTPIENIKKYIKYITIFENPPKLGYVDKKNTDYANKYYNFI
jgi:hypothetical protein